LFLKKKGSQRGGLKEARNKSFKIKIQYPTFLPSLLWYCYKNTTKIIMVIHGISIFVKQLTIQDLICCASCMVVVKLGAARKK